MLVRQIKRSNVQRRVPTLENIAKRNRLMGSVSSVAPNGLYSQILLSGRMAMNRIPMTSGSFKGNKTSLPTKPCQACGRPMTWRKRWAKNWEEVKFCSDRCRANRKSEGT
jgi:hypothetical protein